jgi:SAM-dependent methyltransferase
MDYVPVFACRDGEPWQRELNALYDYQDDVETKVLHRCRINLFHRLMRRLVARGVVTRFERALDIGCNAGFYSKLLADFGFARVVGVDIEAEYVRRARERFGVRADGRVLEFRAQSAEDLDPAEQFDFILCTEVIEHTAQPQRVIAHIKAMLAPGGVGVVTLPNRVSLPYAWAVLTHALRGKPMDAVLRDHLSYPFYRSRRLFEPDGPRLVGCTGTNLFLFGPLLRLLYPQPWFGAVSRVNFELSLLWPLKYLTQFFFLVLKR